MKILPKAFAKSCIEVLARWSGIPIGAGDGTSYNLGSRVDGWCNNEKAVLRLSAAWACVTLLSDAISTLPLTLYKRTPNGREPATDHSLYPVLSRQANADMTSQQWLGALVAGMLLWGESPNEKKENGGRVIAVYPMVPSRTQRTKKQGGGYEYRYVTDDGKQQVLPEASVMRVPAFTLDGFNALSPISYGASVFSSAIGADNAARKTFDNGLMSTVAFSTDQILKKDQRDEFRGTFADTVGGALNAGKPVFLEAGMKGYQLGINPVDAQLLETRAFSVEEICSWFRVQPFMIGRAADGQTNWGTGIEQQMIGFITFTLRPWLKRIESAISKDLLRPEERDTYYAEFNLEGLLRGDSAARQAFYASALQNGWMNRDEVRKLENLPSITGGDVHTVQSNLLPIQQLGQQPAAQGAADALKAWLGIIDKEDSPR